MLKEGKTGVFEAAAIIIIMISSKVLFTSTRAIVDLLGPAAWYGTLISALTALAGFYVVYILIRRFAGQELVPVFETVFGRPAGGLLVLAMGSVFALNAAMMAREFVEAAKVYFYPATPPSFMLAVFVFSLLVPVYLGLEVIARSAALFFWPLVAAFVVIFAFAASLYEPSYLFPVLGHGPAKTVLTGLQRSSVYSDAVALAVFAGALQGTGHLKKAGTAAIVASGLIIAANLFFYLMTMPYLVAAEQTIPMLALTRFIEYGRFFQRFESLFLFSWSISALLAAAINLYTSLSIYCKVFRMDDHRALVLPLGVVLFSLAILPPDISSIAFVYVSFLRQHSWALQTGLPLLALLVARARGKRGGPAGA